MSHRVHPKAYRLRETSDWDSRWQFKKSIPKYLKEDFVIRDFLEERLKDSGVQNIEIERFPGKVNIIINTSKPGFIIGRGGKGAEELKKELEKKIIKSYKPLINQKLTALNKVKEEIRIEIREIRNPWTYSNIIAQWIAQQIERRMPYRRVLKQALSKIMVNKEIKGARVEVSGRLNGAQIARREWIKNGRLPRQTLRADIDYGTARAYCTYGVIGIKVWLYKGEKF
ncbi:30S ribosomal protein S3 [Candidatus Parcubacteria bacterium]|nr:30S ribosomal protein S3 [Candidatus Parcubacteria bacterium]